MSLTNQQALSELIKLGHITSKAKATPMNDGWAFGYQDSDGVSIIGMGETEDEAVADAIEFIQFYYATEKTK